MKFYESVVDLVGRTPLVKLRRIVEPGMADVYVKMENLNPTGSVKDRMAVNMVRRAEETGVLRPGGTLVESTSGNTGLGLAMVAAANGYHCICTMPDKMSQEKIDLLKAYGAEVIVTRTDLHHDHPESYVEVAKRIASETPGALYTDQYYNMSNPEAHYLTTGPEIWEDTDGKIDCLVGGIGTGGTISGTGKYLKEKAAEAGRSVRIVCPDPYGSIYHDEFYKGESGEPDIYRVEGIGHDFMVGTLDMSVIDDVVNVTDRDSFIAARRLARQEGILAGGSTGTVIHGALEEARRLGEGKILVAFICDNGDRYLSKVFNDDWMRDMGYLGPAADLGTAQDVLDFKHQQVIFAEPDESIQTVIDRMVSMGISQMPMAVTPTDLRMVEEIDILRALASNEYTPDDSVRQVSKPLEGQLAPEVGLNELQSVFEENNVAVIVRDGTVLGVVNKIDVLEYMTHRTRAS